MDDLEQFAAAHGIPALLDHLGLDGLGNEVVALYAERDRLREALERIRSLPSAHDLIRNAVALAMYEIAREALDPS